MNWSIKKSSGLAIAFLALALSSAAVAQDPQQNEPGHVAPAPPQIQPGGHFGSSPVHPPEEDDLNFVVDQAGGLDTGCTFRSGGPLVFNIEVDRYIGDKDKLIANGLIGDTALLSMPAFDVDFDANVPGFSPERDRVSFNGNVVPGEFLTGSNGIWLQNDFEIPIDWVEFPQAAGSGGPPTPAQNVIRIDIDVANSQEAWCTAIDWASLTIEVARPVVMAHGIFSEGGVWDSIWVANLDDLGLPNSNALSMGALDGIGSNAGKIAAEIATRKEEWGVEKVNLVGHSKGGLDSRDYVESADDVEQVIQIGTPNLGSPLADKVQQGLLRAGVLPSLILNGLVAAFSGPAGIQLTTPYMAGYNLFHGSNAEVRYTAIAGDYDPDCFFLNPFCRPIPRVMLALSGSPGDTIVPVSSVHSLGFTANRTFPSSGGDQDATHACLFGFSSCQLESQPIFDNLSDRVRAFGSTTPGSSGPVLPPFTSSATAVGSIQQGQIVERVIPVDEQTQIFFTLLYPSGDLDLVLVSPSGLVIDPAFASGDPDTAYEAGEILGGLLEVYNLGLPEVGEWTLRISAPSVVDPAGVGFLANVLLDEPAITLKGEATPANAHAGEALRLTAQVLDSGAPITGASAEAVLGLPDGSQVTVALLDDGIAPDVAVGDGIYTASFSPGDPGIYRAAFVVVGTNPTTGAPFSREDFALATVSRSTSSFAGSFRDNGVDTDGDGLFDELVVQVDLDISTAADYRLFGVLEDIAGNTHEASVESSIPAGAAVADLRFDGGRIFQNGVDGPYTLRIVRLAEEDGLALMPVDELADAYQTAAYGFVQFEHEPVSLTGNGSSQGRDLNGNGLFDLLDVAIEVRVERSGFYRWSARLQDSDGTDLGFAASGGFFSAGVNSVTLSFAGEPIGENGTDGPYVVTSLIVFGAGESLIAQRAFIAEPFLASEFEGFSFDSTPPTLEVELEPNLLWPPNHRLIDVTAVVSVADDIDPDPQVTLVSILSNEADNGLGDGDRANDVQGADFGTDDREFSLRAERSGRGTDRVYTVTYRAVDDAGNAAEVAVTVTVPHDLGH